MNELVKIDFEQQTISARDLHESLEIGTRFNDWFARMCEYGFEEGKDFYSKMSKTSETGGRPSTDYIISIPMAKEICMIQRTPKGKEVRQYLIKVEEAWNTPDMVIARALQMSSRKIEAQKETIKHLQIENEEMKPKAEFFDAVADSKDAIEMSNVAKVLAIPNVGRNKLFEILRNKKILQSDNIPYQKYIDKGWFRTIEQKYNVNGEVRMSIKTLVYQKGVEGIRRVLKQLNL